MKKIVVTGSTGMIGSALVHAALDKGIEVFAVVRPGSAKNGTLPSHPLLQVEECGLDGYSSGQFQGVYDVFFHLAWDKTIGAAREDTDVQEANIRYTLDAVRLAKRLGCRKFVGAGSQAEYGPVSEKLNERTHADPQSGYGIAKYTAGKLSRILCGQLGMEHNWARILSVYGEKDSPQTLIMFLITTLLQGKKPALTPCDQLWDYLYAGDAAEALLTIGEKGVDKRVYCLGSGQALPLKSYVEAVRDCIDPSLPLGFGEKAYYPHQAMFLCADTEDLVQDTGFTPSVSFQEGICRTVDWVKKCSK